MIYDVAIVGAGPAGAVCAAVCAAGGMRTIVVERGQFPREKVCGDCLNPTAWPVLERLGIAREARSLTHARLRYVEFAAETGAPLVHALPEQDFGEIGIRRAILDNLLLETATRAGAEARMGWTLERISHGGHWHLYSGRSEIRARHLVAADGRNSSVARMLGLLPAPVKDRVALQARLPLCDATRERVVMRFLPWGYSGLADIGGGEMNLCLVSRPRHLRALRGWAEKQFPGAECAEWASISPLSRKPIPPVQGSLLLVGDSARVVEPFTGEGIAYAIRSGELAAAALLKGRLADYRKSHRELYRGRLWVNQLARLACLYPSVANSILAVGRRFPAVMQYLTRKVTGAPANAG